MDRINNIINNIKYKIYVERNNKREEEREFCKHNIEHFLDVARIAYIISIEEKICVNKEVIYAVALLHDIGKWQEYEENISHNISSSRLSEEILKESSFDKVEIATIKEAIYNHRDAKVERERNLSGIIYRADKISRNCFNCHSKKECNWADKKKNMKIIY